MQRDVVRGNRSSKVRFGLVDSEAMGEGFKQLFPYQGKAIGRILWPSRDSVIRIIPGNSGGMLFPQLINTHDWTSDGDQAEFLSDTFFMTQTLSGFGDNKLEICSNLKPGSDEAAMYTESPLNYFCNKIHRTMMDVSKGKPTKVRYNDRWRMWTGLQGQLPFPKVTLLFQAICFNLCGRDCTDSLEGGNPAPLYGVIGINSALSIGELIKALVTPMDRRRPIGVDNNTYGSLAEAKGNILYLNSTKDEKNRKYLEPSIVGPDVKTWEPTEYDLEPEQCTTLWTPWDRALKYLTVKEQLELLASEFGADTVNYVFSLSSQWNDLPIPEDIARVGMGSYSDSASQPRVTIPTSTYVKTPVPSTMGMPRPAGLSSIPSASPANMDAIKAEINKIKAAQSGASSIGSMASELAAMEIPDDDEIPM